MMPKGVEHSTLRRPADRATIVSPTLMPKGVEHVYGLATAVQAYRVADVDAERR